MKSASSNCRFQFHKRGQLFIPSYNETFSVTAMRVGNPGYSHFTGCILLLLLSTRQWQSD
jgi:hypothetical protein